MGCSSGECRLLLSSEVCWGPTGLSSSRLLFFLIFQDPPKKKGTPPQRSTRATRGLLPHLSTPRLELKRLELGTWDSSAARSQLGTWPVRNPALPAKAQSVRSACIAFAAISQGRKDRIPRRRNTGTLPWHPSVYIFSDVTMPKIQKAFSSPADRILTTSTDVT